LTAIRFVVSLRALFSVDAFGLIFAMSYVDSDEGDYGGDYPSKDDTIYDYTSYSYDNSANSLGIAIVSSSAPKNYGQLDEPACSVQELKFKSQIASGFADDSNKPSSLFGNAKQQNDYDIQKLQNEVQADPGKYSLQCFGPPQQRPQDFWDSAPEFPSRPEEEGPEIPEKLYRNPFHRVTGWTDWRTRLILEFFEKAEEE
jgi:hypothetical protein